MKTVSWFFFSLKEQDLGITYGLSVLAPPINFETLANFNKIYLVEYVSTNYIFVHPMKERQLSSSDKKAQKWVELSLGIGI